MYNDGESIAITRAHYYIDIKIVFNPFQSAGVYIDLTTIAIVKFHAITIAPAIVLLLLVLLLLLLASCCEALRFRVIFAETENDTEHTSMCMLSTTKRTVIIK